MIALFFQDTYEVFILVFTNFMLVFIRFLFVLICAISIIFLLNYLLGSGLCIFGSWIHFIAFFLFSSLSYFVYLIKFITPQNLMTSTLALNQSRPELAFTFYNLGVDYLICAYAPGIVFEQKIPPHDCFNFYQIEQALIQKNYEITLFTQQSLKIEIGLLKLELKSSQKSLINNFQQTVTMVLKLAGTLDSQLQKIEAIEKTTTDLKKQVGQIHLQIDQIANNLAFLTRKIQQNQNLKTEIQQLREQIKNSREKENQLDKTCAESPSRSSIQKKMSSSQFILSENPQMSEISADQELDELSGLETLNLVKKITSQMKGLMPDQQIKDEGKGLIKQLKDAYQILQATPKIIWKNFDLSNILKLQQEKDTIKSFFNKKILTMNLIYCASKEYFSVKKFHAKCDIKPNTLVLVKTQFGKIIGGFTPVDWSSADIEKFCKDQSGESFIFSLTHKQRFDLRNKQCATQNFKNWGPVFGNDLVLDDKANHYSNCYAKLSCYGSKKLSEDHWTMKETLGGNPKQSNNFKVLEWEVWHLEF